MWSRLKIRKLQLYLLKQKRLILKKITLPLRKKILHYSLKKILKNQKQKQKTTSFGTLLKSGQCSSGRKNTSSTNKGNLDGNYYQLFLGVFNIATEIDR